MNTISENTKYMSLAWQSSTGQTDLGGETTLSQNESAVPDDPMEAINTVSRLFEIFDEDGDKKLSVKELPENLLDTIVMGNLLTTQQTVSSGNPQTGGLFDQVDQNGDGMVSKGEWDTGRNLSKQKGWEASSLSYTSPSEFLELEQNAEANAKASAQSAGEASLSLLVLQSDNPAEAISEASEAKNEQTAAQIRAIEKKVTGETSSFAAQQVADAQSKESKGMETSDERQAEFVDKIESGALSDSAIAELYEQLFSSAGQSEPLDIVA